MEIQYKKMQTDQDIATLATLAGAIWHEYFPCILSAEQIDYMVEKFQSYAAMKKQMETDGYEYYLICRDGAPIGYTGFVREAEKMFLSKLYLKKECRGQGIASQAFAFLIQECKKSNLHAIYLTVNRHNAPTIAVYEKKGFVKVSKQVADIGNGYVMDDYIMELSL